MTDRTFVVMLENFPDLLLHEQWIEQVTSLDRMIREVATYVSFYGPSALPHHEQHIVWIFTCQREDINLTKFALSLEARGSNQTFMFYHP